LKDPANRNILSTAFGEQGDLYVMAARFELPKLLLAPIYHMNHYFALVDALALKCPVSEQTDRQHFWQAASQLKSIKAALDVSTLAAKLADVLVHIPSAKIDIKRSYLKFSQPLAFEQQVQLAKVRALVGDAQAGEISNSCGKLLQDITVRVQSAKGETERRAFLFENLLVCCKPVSGKGPELRIKESFHLRAITVEVLPNATGLDANTFRLVENGSAASGAGSKLLFRWTHPELRDGWVAMFKANEMLRFLTQLVVEKETQDSGAAFRSLLPDPRLYSFATLDSTSNIIFDDGKATLGRPVVRAGTLLKLVERLTYPQYADLSYLRQFFGTYRSFCSPEELLDLLVLRYRVPQPHWLDKTLAKRYNRTYAIPIKVRIINVLKHWIDKQYTDFENSPLLLRSLLTFIRDDVAADPTTKKAICSVTHSIRRQRLLPHRNRGGTEEHRLQRLPVLPPPDILWFAGGVPATPHLLTVHPAETARQLTLIEAELFSAVEMSELNGLRWTKPGKEQAARHVLALAHRFNLVCNWVVRTIVETPNLQERADVVMYFLEVLRELHALNNFNGVMELVSALGSSMVIRLKHTWAELDKLSSKRRRVLDECSEQMSPDRNYKQIRVELAQVEGACVPFFGMYLSDIVFIEESNKDFLKTPGAEAAARAATPASRSSSGATAKVGLINFSKRRLLAKTMGEIQALQGRPYSLSVQPEIRGFLLDFPVASGPNGTVLPGPTAAKSEIETFNDAMYDASRSIEPRDAEKSDLPVGVRLFDDKAAKVRRDVVIALLAKSGRGKSVSIISTPSGTGQTMEGRGSTASVGSEFASANESAGASVLARQPTSRRPNPVPRSGVILRHNPDGTSSV
jgi:son of sevenless-like protein